MLFPLMACAATDERNYVKKAVSRALRNVGKGNRNLNQAVLSAVEEIGRVDSRAARWIAADVKRELESDAARTLPRMTLKEDQ